MHENPRIIKLLTVTVFFWVSLFLCNAVQAEDIDYSTIGWWQIRFRQIDQEVSGCYAIAQFQGQTSITLSLLQHAKENKKQWVVHIDNPRRHVWTGTKKHHTLHFVTTKPWRGTFSVADDNSLFQLVYPEFMNSLADAHSLTILSANNHVLTHISMKDLATKLFDHRFQHHVLCSCA